MEGKNRFETGRGVTSWQSSMMPAGREAPQKRRENHSGRGDYFKEKQMPKAGTSRGGRMKR